MARQHTNRGAHDAVIGRRVSVRMGRQRITIGDPPSPEDQERLQALMRESAEQAIARIDEALAMLAGKKIVLTGELPYAALASKNRKKAT